MRSGKTIGLLVLALGIMAIVLGAVFLGLGGARYVQLQSAMRAEKVTLGIEGAEVSGDVIDTFEEALKAGDTIREHRHSIAPSYQDLLGSGRYDPTNPKHLTYAQAMNLENYLYLAVAAFGLTQIAMGSGAFMILTGIALGGTGIVLVKLSSKTA